MRWTLSAFIAFGLWMTSCTFNPSAHELRAIDEPIYAHAVVACDHPLASQAGLEMLKQGGNAVDAAVASSFALSVVRPYSCGLGGGGFMVIHIPAAEESAARSIALNYRETAPAAVGPDYFLNLNDNSFGESASRDGVHAVGIPGTVAGLLHALEHYGTLDRTTILAPAIRLAERGFPADKNHIKSARSLSQKLAAQPSLQDDAEYIWTQLCHRGTIELGDTITNPAQAQALHLIAQEGADAFYRGKIAGAIASVMQKRNGPITKADLAGYTIRTLKPLRGRFLDREILTMPLPSSGGVTMLQILGLLERKYEQFGRPSSGTAAYIHLVTEAMKHAFADRSRFLADDAFVSVPVDALLDPKNLDELAARIDRGRTFSPDHYGSSPRVATPIPEDHGTSHISVIDENGMAVACTETINLNYGSLVVVPGFGFALNNEMDDFTTDPQKANAFGLTQSKNNLPAPGKRPLSSMSPTIVLENGKPVLIAGASGGPRIITGTLQAILNCLLFDMTPGQAVAAPRFHHQWRPDQLRFEPSWPNDGTREAMQKYGHDIGVQEVVGQVQLIRVGKQGMMAASDPRKGGKPAGY